MAHAAEISRLTAELVNTLFSSQSKHTTNLETRKKEAFKILNSTRLGRTNQFEVFAHLQGIEERCLINSNPGVAEALRERREKLASKEEKWLPEILHVLTELSDRPSEKSRTEDLLPPVPEQEDEQLTWDELIADDQLQNQDGIWSKIDYATEGTDSQASDDESVALSNCASHSSNDEALEVAGGLYEDLVAAVNVTDLDSVKAAQSWRQGITNHESGVHLNERQLLRECLSMLDGLPTSAFRIDGSGLTVPKVGFRISYVSHTALYDTLRGFSDIGDALNTLRQWTSRDEKCPVLQTSRAVVKSHLFDIQVLLREHAASIIDYRANSTSLLSVHESLQKKSKITLELAKIFDDVNNYKADQRSIGLLDVLYLKACDCQDVGNTTGFEFFNMFFLRLLATYLKPIHVWMSSGEVPSLSPFFVKISHDFSSMSDLWQKGFHLIPLANSNTIIPKILQPMIPWIFSAGKATSFLKYLSNDLPKGTENSGNDIISYQNMYQLTHTDQLEPFAERLASHLNIWVRNAHAPVSRRLRHHLETSCGLHRTLDSLEYIFLRRDGSLSDSFARELLSYNEPDNNAPKLSVHLTQTLRDVYNGVPCIDPEAITARLQPASKTSIGCWISSDSVAARLCIQYQLPWSVANIIRQSTIATYQRLNAVILQVIQAKVHLENLPSIESCARPREEVVQANAFRWQLILFTNTIVDYLCGIALQETTKNMRKDLTKAEGIDDMIRIHQNYICRLEHQCLVSNEHEPISKALGAILRVATEFAEQSSRAGEKADAHVINTSKMQDRYKKLHAFALAALKSTGRSGAEPSLMIFAEMLSLLGCP